MEQYTVYFGALALISIAMAYKRHRAEKDEVRESLAFPAGEGQATANKFKMEFFGVWVLVVAADWLQVRSQACNVASGETDIASGPLHVHTLQG